jgi:hypothetical protein
VAGVDADRRRPNGKRRLDLRDVVVPGSDGRRQLTKPSRANLPDTVACPGDGGGHGGASMWRRERSGA